MKRQRLKKKRKKQLRKKMSDEEKQVPELEPFCVKRRFAPQITNLNDLDVRAKFFEEMEVDGSSIASEQQVHAFSISDETVDRHGDVVSASGWVTDHYNGVVLWAHNQAQPPVAKSQKLWKHRKALKSVAAFTPKDMYAFGDLIGQMFAAGFLTDVSVGFKALDYEAAPAVEQEARGGSPLSPAINFKRQELLEYSAVTVGANRNAKIQKSAFDFAKEAGIDTTPVAEYLDEYMQKHADALGMSKSQLEKLYFAHREKEIIISTPPLREPLKKATNTNTTVKINLQNWADELAAVARRELNGEDK